MWSLSQERGKERETHPSRERDDAWLGEGNPSPLANANPPATCTNNNPPPTHYRQGYLALGTTALRPLFSSLGERGQRQKGKHHRVRVEWGEEAKSKGKAKGQDI